jgi:TatD DNase family protein
MIDTHCHLVYEGADPEPAIARAREAGLKAIVTCGYPRDYGNNMAAYEKHAGFIFLTLGLGLHPIDIKDMTADEVDKYLDNIRLLKDKILAVGEIGLDYHWFPLGKNVDEDKRFKEAFSKSLELAKDIGKPVVLHTRKAEQDCFDIVVSHGFKPGQACFHCYAGNMTLAREIIDKGFLISLSSNMDKSKNTKKIAKSFPLEQLLTETDSPFLSPIPGKKNEPANVKLVVERIAELRGMPVAEVDKQTTDNAVKFFGMKI